jgi:hypothetical protein
MKVMGSLVAVVLIACACTASDGAPKPKDGAVASSSPEVTPSPTPSGSPALEVGQAIDARVVFKGRVSADDREFVKRMIDRAYTYFKVPNPPGKPEMRYAEVYGKGSPYASEKQLCGRRTDAGGIQIYLQACRDLGRDVLVETIVHEVFHALQDFTRDTYRRGPDIVIEGLYPHWYEEGSAVFAAAVALDDWGILAYSENRSTNLDRARDIPETLKQLEFYRGWRKGDVFGHYCLAFLGVERAVGKRDWRKALAVYQAAYSHQVPRWDQAFKETFGVSMKRFYREFNRYQDHGLTG